MMKHDISLSACQVTTGINRTSPRPVELRDENYASNFDWKQLFYDVYRVGPDIVLQGPPMYGLFEKLREVEPFRSALRWPFRKAKHYGHRKRGEIWLRSDADRISFESELGDFDLAVQPNYSDLFANQRVLLTLSKNNEIPWIVDWLKFHHRVQGATSALIYDNSSTIYSAQELQLALNTQVPEMNILVVSWPFIYGPQAGPFAAVNGVEPEWDSDFCQIGVLQHARFRFLLGARSVMHNDIDELVISNGSRTVFEAAEQNKAGMAKFPGRWISVATEHPVEEGQCRHADFTLIEEPRSDLSPPKWCIRPEAFPRKISWGVHNIFDVKCNEHETDEFLFRHLKGVTDNWKYKRWGKNIPDAASLEQDKELVAAYDEAGLKRYERARSIAVS